MQHVWRVRLSNVPPRVQGREQRGRCTSTTGTLPTCVIVLLERGGGALPPTATHTAARETCKQTNIGDVRGGLGVLGSCLRPSRVILTFPDHGRLLVGQICDFARLLVARLAGSYYLDRACSPTSYNCKTPVTRCASAGGFGTLFFFSVRKLPRLGWLGPAGSR
ncbi:hypothetical protein V5799_030091 [Amblyomma americanum]|uniref:Uncharacterized protein n=1 Tax=Amblyomma americanum TaxID=6943 RepID=A0AAQ4EPE5_AMBAM